MSNGDVNADSAYVARLAARLEYTAARVIAYAQAHDVPISALATIRLPWYEIRAEATERGQDPASTTVFIFDEIGGSMGLSAKKFAADLEEITTPLIKVRINSPGGSVFDSIAIFNALNHHSARVITYIDGLAASGASVIAMAGERIVMMPGSQMMIHDASMTQEGNAAEMGKAQIFLDRQSNNVAGIYAEARGGDPADWRELMLAETWTFAREAIEMGIADEVAPVRKPDPQEDQELRALMTRRFDVSGRYRYASRDAAPPPQTVRFTRGGGAPIAPARPVASVQVGQTRTAPVAAPADGPATADLLEAARMRQEAAAMTRQDVHALGLTPLGQARRLSTAWMTRAGGPRAGAADLPTRLRASEQTRDGKTFNVVDGYATVYEREYDMWDMFGPYKEIVSAGAGEHTISQNPDTVFLVNHGGLAMARTLSANTLELWSDATGMGDRAWLNPHRSDVKDLVINIDDRVTTEQSFAFMIDDGEWSPDFTTYRIHQYDVNRGDVSAVNWGANPYTSIAARSREILEELERMPLGAAREALARLNRRGDLDSGQMTRLAGQPATTVTASGAPIPVSRSLDALQEWLTLADARRG